MNIRYVSVRFDKIASKVCVCVLVFLFHEKWKEKANDGFEDIIKRRHRNSFGIHLFGNGEREK